MISTDDHHFQTPISTATFPSTPAQERQLLAERPWLVAAPGQPGSLLEQFVRVVEPLVRRSIENSTETKNDGYGLR